MAMTEAQRREHMQKLGLDPDKAAMAPAVMPASKPSGEIGLAPEGVDPRTMPVTDIEFDPRLLDGFDLKKQRREAADHVFALYKSAGRNKDRNSLLWSRISKFITDQALANKTGGAIKEKVKATADQREQAAMLAGGGVTSEDLGQMVQVLTALSESGMSMADLIALLPKKAEEAR